MVSRAARGDRRAVPRLHGPQARARRVRPRRPAAVLARAGARRGIGPRLAAAFDHVLVDEYQDVNGLQVDLARVAGLARATVTAVGDDFQAIYGFRSASAAHILDFPEHFPGTRVVRWSATTARRSRCSTSRTRSPRRRRARSRSGCARTARAACGRASCACATRRRRPRRSATRSWRLASRAWSCARRPCWRARRTTPTCWSSS